MTYTGRLGPKGVPFSGFGNRKNRKGRNFTSKVFERLGISVISVIQKAQKNNKCVFMAVTGSKKRSGFVICSSILKTVRSRLMR